MTTNYKNHNNEVLDNGEMKKKDGSVCSPGQGKEKQTTSLRAFSSSKRPKNEIGFQEEEQYGPKESTQKEKPVFEPASSSDNNVPDPIKDRTTLTKFSASVIDWPAGTGSIIGAPAIGKRHLKKQPSLKTKNNVNAVKQKYIDVKRA